jgi:PAS domain S-box-containing protein
VTVADDWLGTEAALLVPLGAFGLLGVGGDADRLDGDTAGLLRLVAANATVALELVDREATLREQRDRLAVLFEHATDAIVEVEVESAVESTNDAADRSGTGAGRTPDRDGDGDPDPDPDPDRGPDREADEPVAIVRRVNGAFERVFGHDASEVVGRRLREVVVPDGSFDEGGLLRAESGAPAGDGSRETEVTRETADGSREFRVRAVSFEYGDGSSGGYVVYTDVTEREWYVRTLTRLHEATRELVRVEGTEAVADIAVRAAREILDVPINGVRLHDADRDALVLVAATDEVYEEMGERPPYRRGETAAWEAFVSGEPRVVDATDDDIAHPGVEHVAYLPLGDHGTLSLASREPDDFDESTVRLGRVLAASVEVALDRAEQTEVLRRRERELERQNERLTEFASVVSHDLRNPLSVAQGYAELARQSMEANDVEEALDRFERVERAHERMNDLITDLLTLAREGERVGDTEVVALGEAARDAWTAVETRSATLSIDEDRQLAADPERLASLLENLFGNAVEHGGADVVVTVEGTTDGFAVADDGPGIPAEDRERVFERGYSTGDHGTGFGLSIVREIAEAHGWSIRAEESADGGARFVVTGVDREPSS